MTNRSLTTWLAFGHLANDWPIAATAGVAMGLSPVEIGLLFTILNIGGALAYLPAGFLADRGMNRGRLLLATFWWVAIGYGLAATAPGYWALAMLLAVAGMGNAAWHPIAAGVLASGSKERRAQNLGIHAIGGSVAEVLAPLFVGLLLAHVSWRGALLISALPAALMGVCFFRVARAVPRIGTTLAGKQEVLDLLDTWRRGSGLRLVATICLYNMALLALLSMIPLYLAEAHGFSAAAVGMTFSALLVTGASMQPWLGRISDRAGRRPVLVLGNLIAALASAALILQPSFWPMVAAIALAIAAMDAIRSATLAAAVDHADHGESTTLGLAFVVMDGVGALGSVLAGVAAGISWPHMFGLVAMLSLGASALAATVRRPADAVTTGRQGLAAGGRERAIRRRA